MPRQLKMLAAGHTETPHPTDPEAPATIVRHAKGDVLTFEDDREADALRLVELKLAEDVTPAPAPQSPPVAAPTTIVAPKATINPAS